MWGKQQHTNSQHRTVHEKPTFLVLCSARERQLTDSQRTIPSTLPTIPSTLPTAALATLNFLDSRFAYQCLWSAQSKSGTRHCSREVTQEKSPEYVQRSNYYTRGICRRHFLYELGQHHAHIPSDGITSTTLMNYIERSTSFLSAFRAVMQG